MSDRPSIPEVNLAAAILHRALEDALTPDDRLARRRTITTDTGPRQVFTVGLKPREREEAVRFLLDPAAGWTGAREAWCDAAGIDPAVIQRHALRGLPRTSVPVDLCRALGLPVPPPRPTEAETVAAASKLVLPVAVAA